jgi:hypothetical protein
MSLWLGTRDVVAIFFSCPFALFLYFIVFSLYYIPLLLHVLITTPQDIFVRPEYLTETVNLYFTNEEKYQL